MSQTIAVVGVPTALGGQLPDKRHIGMAEAPAALRGRGFMDRLREGGLGLRDDGDLRIEPGYHPDPDPQAQNRALIAEFLPREAAMVAPFGAGMLGTPAGLAALEAWASAVGREVDGLYIAIDHDVLDASGDWSVTMPEPGGLPLEAALDAVRALATAIPVVGYGATAMNFGRGDGPKTVGD